MVKKTVNSLIVLTKKYFPILFLIGVLIISAYLRLWKIEDYMTFLGDEGRDVLVVKKMLVDHKFTLLGPTASVGGFFLGPIYYYFMLPFLWVFNLNPVGPAVMVALFGIATVFLVFVIGNKLFSSQVGLIASTIYALSPVVINYSHSSWNPNLVPFFACLLVYFLYKYRQDNRKHNLFIVGGIIGIGIQLHYLFLFLVVFTAIYLLIINKKDFIKNLFPVLIGFTLLFLPFILFEIRHGFTNTKMILKFVFVSNDTGFNLITFLNTTKEVSYRLFFRLVAENRFIPTLITIIVAFYGLTEIKKNRKYDSFLLLVLWCLIPVLLFGLYKKNIYDYYFGIIFPTPFLFTAIGIAKLLERKQLLPFGIIIFVYLAVINWQSRPFVYEPNKQLQQVKNASLMVLEKAENKPFNFALITDHNSDHAYRYFFEIYGHKAVIVENITLDPKRTSVTGQLLVVCEVSDCKPLGYPSWDIAGYGRAEITGKWTSSVLEIYKLIPYKGVL
jgi:4-amino-4-deoxy-L-arabinose transferase-like glycosyltransferase